MALRGSGLARGAASVFYNCIRVAPVICGAGSATLREALSSLSYIVKQSRVSAETLSNGLEKMSKSAF